MYCIIIIIFRYDGWVFSIYGKRAKILGWGGTTEKPKPEDKPQCDLLEAYQKVDSGHRCPAQSERKICVHHGDEKAASACFGDSGGPLIMDQGGYGVVIGIASHLQERDCSPEDIKCLMDARCNKEGVSVYTKVSAYLPWIKKTTGQGKSSTRAIQCTKQVLLFSRICTEFLIMLFSRNCNIYHNASHCNVTYPNLKHAVPNPPSSSPPPL